MRTIFLNYLKQYNYTYFNIKTVLFDMDGVLYDSMPAHAKSWQQTMQEFGFKSTTSEEFYYHEGRIGRATINLITEREFGRKATQEEVKEIYGRKTKLFNQYNSGKVIKYSKKVIKKVKAEGYLPVLVTGSGQPTLLEKLDKNFPHTFSPANMITAFDVKSGKPHPEPFLLALKKAGNLHPNQAIVIENAPLGVESAVKAGIFTIAVNTGTLPDDVLKNAGAHLILPSMKALKEKLPEIFQTINSFSR